MKSLKEDMLRMAKAPKDNNKKGGVRIIVSSDVAKFLIERGYGNEISKI